MAQRTRNPKWSREAFCLYSEVEDRNLDAKVSLEFVGDKIRIFINSSGGRTGNAPDTNSEYDLALALFLRRLQVSGAVLHCVRLASKTVNDESESERLLFLESFQLPMRFEGQEDIDLLQKSIQKSAASAFRKPNAKGPGNHRKRLEFEVSVLGRREDFISYLMHGNRTRIECNSWIFQANPDTFDIDSYLETRYAEGEPIRWVVRQYSSTVRAGDKVFIWRSAGKKRGASGVIASGWIHSNPEVMSDDSGGLWSEGEMPDETRVSLIINEIRLCPEEGMLLTESFKADPILQDLRILKLRAETNYLLPAEQASELDSHWQIKSEGPDQADPNPGFKEGDKRERLHIRRERNRMLVETAKRLFIDKHGRLFCEACGFDAHEAYGLDQKALIEAHHKIAISELESGSYTRVEDLAMLCPNCHRVVHHCRPWLTVDELISRIRTK